MKVHKVTLKLLDNFKNLTSLRTIMNLSFGIYKKQLVFFLALFIIIGAIFYFLNRQLSSASVNDLAISNQSGIFNIDIYIDESGNVTINNQDFNRYLHIESNKDELRYIAADKQGVYLDELNIYVHLPKAVSIGEVTQQTIAVHGVGSYRSFLKDPQTLAYSASSLSPQSTLTIVAEFPKNMFNFPLGRKIVASVFNLSPFIWLIISIILPITTLIVLLFMFQQTIRDWQKRKPKEVLDKPPSDMKPSEVEVLVEGKVSARSIAATLLDLAERDIIRVVSHRDTFTFGKKKPLDINSMSSDKLQRFEQIFLSKIFTKEELKSTIKDIQVRIGQHVFSRKIAEVYVEIYENISRRGYFVENPSVMHRHFRKIGFIFFFIGVIGFIFGIFFAPDPKFYLIFWAGMIFTSFIIIKMSPQLPIRTAKGQEEVYKWLEFKNFLSDPSPIGYIEGAQEIFEKYLSYAIVLRCESEWSKRFIEHPFRQPDWYFSDKPVIILEDFVNDIFPVIGFISKELSASKEPIV